MKISILGAGNEVTGSAFLVETGFAKVLVDCGQFQGGNREENRNTIPKAFLPQSLDAVVISHGHLDHIGRLPLLTLKGYKGPIYATPATIDVARLILKDSAKIQEQEAERINRKRVRAGQELISPLFTDKDVDATLRLFQPVDYAVSKQVAPGVQVRLLESGHILGSCIVEMTIKAEGAGEKDRTVVFSGDLGPIGLPILKDPVRLDRADWVFMESTYGDRDHRPLQATVEEFHAIIRQAIQRKGKILVPSFALGRTQQIIYYLAEAFHKKVVDPFPVYVDSPLGIAATEVYGRHPELYDAEMREFVLGNKMQDALKTIHFTQTAAESMALNDTPGPCLIIAGSGMCTAGRILHHLKHNLWRPETTVVFVGYQAPGSLGRRLVDGAEEASIFGEKIAVRSAIKSLGGFSAHAGQTDLINWFSSMAGSSPRTTLIHGEERGRKPLARLIEQKWGIKADLPNTGDVLTWES